MRTLSGDSSARSAFQEREKSTHHYMKRDLVLTFQQQKHYAEASAISARVSPDGHFRHYSGTLGWETTGGDEGVLSD